MIRNFLMSTVALVAIGGTALAADLPSRRAPPVYVPPIPVFSWTGFYVGGQVGFAFGQENVRIAAPAAVAGIGGSQRPNGIIGGAHMGYNFSTQGLGFGGAGILGGSGLVIGVEGDIDGSDYRITAAAGPAATQLRSEIQGSARGRLGLAVDRALFYATGGAAFTQFRTTYTVPGFALALASTKVGWTVGGGMEYAITTQWSLRAEYRYSDFGSFNDNLGVAGLVINRRQIQQRAQVGFSYKFDTPVAPVVARY